MLIATLVTIFMIPPVAWGAWRVFRLLTPPPAVGRHRLAVTAEPYRPRPAAARTGPVVIPGPMDPAATGVLDTRDLVAPVPLVRQQAPLTSDVSALMDTLVADLTAARLADWDEALREGRAREQALTEVTREVARLGWEDGVSSIPARAL